jgi:hypothetical protein
MSLQNLVGRTLERVAPDRAAVAAGTVTECIAQAKRLHADVKAWLAANKPDLL